MTVEVTALLVSLRVALGALLLVVPLGLPLAWWLSRRGGVGAGRRGLATLIDGLVLLPMVLPPTAVGLGLLVVFGRDGLGPALAGLGLAVVGSPLGAALASAVVALPVFVRVARDALDQVDRRLEGMAATLGASPTRVLVTVTLPLAGRGLLAAGTLALARALGEFGATVMVAGSVAGVTQTLPLAIFEAAEAREPHAALRLVLVSFVLGLALALVAARLEPRSERAT